MPLSVPKTQSKCFKGIQQDTSFEKQVKNMPLKINYFELSILKLPRR